MLVRSVTGLAEARDALLEYPTDERRQTLIFLQTEGRLDRLHQKISSEILTAGGTIFEENVFNLASTFRPVHANYVMLSTSHDGLSRWRLRTCLLRRCSGVRVAVVPILMFGSVTEYERRLKGRGDDFTTQRQQVTIYRQGRPSMITWTGYEAGVLRFLDASVPELSFSGLARGVPEPLKAHYAKSGFEVLPYSKDQDELTSDWERADVYVHYNRIGETFGVSVIEAALLGLPVVFPVSPRWNHGAIEYLNGFKLLTGSKRNVRKQLVSFVLNERNDTTLPRMVPPAPPELVDPVKHIELLKSTWTSAAPLQFAPAFSNFWQKQTAHFGRCGAMYAVLFEFFRALRAYAEAAAKRW